MLEGRRSGRGTRGGTRSRAGSAIVGNIGELEVLVATSALLHTSVYSTGAAGGMRTGIGSPLSHGSPLSQGSVRLGNSPPASDVGLEGVRDSRGGGGGMYSSACVIPDSEGGKGGGGGGGGATLWEEAVPSAAGGGGGGGGAPV